MPLSGRMLAVAADGWMDLTGQLIRGLESQPDAVAAMDSVSFIAVR